MEPEPGNCLPAGLFPVGSHRDQVLALRLLTMFINDLEEKLKSSLIQSAADRPVGGAVNDEEGR